LGSPASPGAEYVGDYVLALAFGIVFQYPSIAPMRGLGLKDGLIAAAKADFISLTAFEPVLCGWMTVSVLGALAGLCLVSRLLPRPPGPP
jgi:Domain of unknown function (DUF4396)